MEGTDRVELWFGAELTDDHRKWVVQWVRDNGIDPRDVPADATFVTEGGKLTVDVFVRDEQGRMVIDPEAANRMKRGSRTVPLRAPWRSFPPPGSLP